MILRYVQVIRKALYALKSENSKKRQMLRLVFGAFVFVLFEIFLIFFDFLLCGY